MFSAPKNTINFADELNNRSVILVAPTTSHLHDLSPVFGKFIISRIIAAALTRSKTGNTSRVHLYIDECGPYVDEKLAELMTTMRSRGVGATLAFTTENQMGQYESSIRGQAAINLTGLDKDSANPPTWVRFTCQLPDKTFPVTVPIGLLDREQHMSEKQYLKHRRLNKKGGKYRAKNLRRSPLSKT